MTICTQDRRCVLGEIVEGEVVLSPASLVVEEEWRASEEIIVNKEKKPVVKIVPITAFKNERTLGGGKEIVKYISPDFDDSLEELKDLKS